MTIDKTESISLYDKEGKEYLVPRESYRTDILPGLFEKSWDDEDELYSIIVATLRDEFYQDALSPALRYHEISTSPESSAVLLGIIYMKLERLQEARETLQLYLDQHGDSGVILTNLAKVIADEGDADESLHVLWKSLEVNPNQDNALDWWSAIHYEKGGDNARLDSIQQVADLPGSWRAPLWLARHYLEAGEKSKALAIYQSSLASGAATHGDALMMITGDLANNNNLADAVTLVAPIYDPQRHGIETGVNLVMAYEQLGMSNRGLTLLAQLEELGRYDWMEYLHQLKSELSGN